MKRVATVFVVSIFYVQFANIYVEGITKEILEEINFPIDKTNPSFFDESQDEDSYPHHCKKMSNVLASSRSKRMIGGRDPERLRMFPWLALIGYEEDEQVEYNCHGALINSRYVLTAAHCIITDDGNGYENLVSVRLGEHNFGKMVDCYKWECAPPAQDFAIASVHVQPEYDASSMVADIALIRLAKRATITEFTTPICLPTRDRSKLGSELIAAGWGKIDAKNSPDVLKYVKLSIVNQSVCDEEYEDELTEAQFCAKGENGEDTCVGDSGGPVVRVSPGRGVWEAVGVVSYGYKLCKKGHPGVYTDVAAYTSWIKATLKKSNEYPKNNWYIKYVLSSNL